MRMLKSIFAIFLLAFFSACGASGQPGNTASPAQPKANFETGKLIPEVKVYTDTTQHYAIFLPKTYKPDTAWGAIYFFDAQGRAQLPLKKYSMLADMFELVLIASYNSQNGQSPAQSNAIIDHLLRDTQEKLSLDPKRRYAAGFSGGARVAANAAQNGKFQGIIACAAGFQPRQSDTFDYIGIVGMEDFNYQEMRQLDQALDQTKVHHLFEYTTLGHEWPPLNFMAKGFQFLQLRSMAAGALPRIDEPVQSMLSKYRYQDSLMAAQNQDIYRLTLQRKTLAYLTGLTDVTAIQALSNQLKRTPAAQQDSVLTEMEFQREMAMRQQYVQALQTAPIQYWERTAPMLRKIGTNGQEKEAWLNMRVLNFLSLNAYMQATSALQQANLTQADRYVTLYSLIDPANNEHAYLRAQINIRKNDPTAALAALEQAFALDFRDWQRLSTDPAFTGIQSRPDFQDLLNRMKTIPPTNKD